MQNLLAQHLPQLLKVSWQGAVLILLVLAAQWIFGAQLKPRWRYALWLLVLVRLALPWTIPSPASVFNFVDFSHVTKPWKFHLPAHPAKNPSPASVQAQDQATVAAAEITAASSPSDAAVRYVLVIWGAGVLALSLSLLVSHFRISRKISRQRPLIDAPILNRLEECKQLMGVRVPVTVVETGEVGSPTLFGFIRPRLLLPAGFTRSFSPEELHHVFLHELAHIKRCDILIGWLMTAAQILHWFNPLVWFAAYRMRVDRELACDALALSYAHDEENQRYGETIIKLLESFGRSAWSPGLAGAVENRKQLKERISMIAKFKKTNRGLALAVGLFAGLGIVTLTDARPDDSATPIGDISGRWVFVGRPGEVGAPMAVGGVYKVRTDHTWSISEANPLTGASIFDHGGTYKIKDNYYLETVEHANGSSSGLLNKTYTFEATSKDGLFTQKGVGNPWNEVWKHVDAELPKPRKLEPKGFDGTWVGHDSADDKGELSLVFHGSTIEFHEADTNDWLKAKFELYDTTPKQIIGTITDCPDTNAVGMFVCAIYELKDGELTMSGYMPGTPAVPTKFEAPGARKIVFKKK